MLESVGRHEHMTRGSDENLCPTQDDRISSLNGGVGPTVNRLELLTVVILPFFQSHYFVGEDLPECLPANLANIIIFSLTVCAACNEAPP